METFRDEMREQMRQLEEEETARWRRQVAEDERAHCQQLWLTPLWAAIGAAIGNYIAAWLFG